MTREEYMHTLHEGDKFFVKFLKGGLKGKILEYVVDTGMECGCITGWATDPNYIFTKADFIPDTGMSPSGEKQLLLPEEINSYTGKE